MISAVWNSWCGSIRRWRCIRLNLITGDPALAEDLAQTAFLRLANKIDQFDEKRPFRPWFLRTVVNDAIKAAKRQQKTVFLDESVDEAVLDWLVDKTPRPEECAEASDLARKVWIALQQLPPEHRAVIIQRHFLDMSDAEMVEKLQVPASTVKWWLYSARNSLKALFAEENHEQR